MKTIITLLFLCFSLNSFSADWDLFPLNQKSFYYQSQSATTGDVHVFLNDSVNIINQDTVFYFLAKMDFLNAGNCYFDTLREFALQNYLNYYIDSFVQRNDTIYNFSPLSSNPFYFLPKAFPGQSWTITSTNINNDYNQITINCSAIQVQQFLGITDSVKVFTMTANGASSGQVAIANYSMRLSKNYGLIEFVPFKQFLYHPAHTSFIQMNLIGFDSAGTKVGYQQPLFHDYFHLSPGDILQWHFHYDAAIIWEPDYDEYRRDSITQVIIAPDSITYIYNMELLDSDLVVTYHSNLTRTYSKSEFAGIIETAPLWVGTGSAESLMPFGIGFAIWYSNNLHLEISGGDTVNVFSPSTGCSTIDTGCNINQTTDLGADLSINDHAGITMHCYWNFSSWCTYLIGSRVNGVVSGNISVSGNELLFPKKTLTISPNPACEFITVKNISDCKTWEIFESTGKKVKSGNHIQLIEINDLSAGIYIICLQTNKGETSGRFIKTEHAQN
jgi:hypothetical protein